MMKRRRGSLYSLHGFKRRKTRAKDKEVPADVYEHTLSRFGFAMSVASFHTTVVSDARRSASRLGHVFGQANRVCCVRDDRVRHAGVSKETAPLRSVLQLLQPFCLGGPRVG